jgi:DNA-binding YbaB/EbfC family protein
MNIQKLMQQAQQMQARLQKEMQEMVVEATVGGGMVTVRMSGAKQLVGVEIDPEVLDPEDPAMVQDLVLAAVNEAARKVDEELQAKMGGVAGGLAGGLGGLGGLS